MGIESRKIYDFLKSKNSQRNLEMSVESTWVPRVSNKLKSLNRNEKLNVLRTRRKCVYKNSFYPISGCYEFKKEKSDYIFKTSRDFILRRQSKKGEDIISEINRYTSKLDGKKNEEEISHQTSDCSTEFDFDIDQDDKKLYVREDGRIAMAKEEDSPEM